MEDIESLIEAVVSRLKKYENVRTIILIGSQARGDSNEFSDIDLVIITNGYYSRTEIEKILPINLKDIRLSLLTYPSDRFMELYQSGALFMLHVINEGIVLFDDGFYNNLRKTYFRLSKEDLTTQWKIIKQTMKLYNDLDIYGGIYITCLSHLFSIIKNVAVTSLASKGDYEFNKTISLDKLKIYYPTLEQDIEELSELKKYSLLWSKNIRTKNFKYEFYSKEKTIKHIKQLNKIIKKVELNEFR